MAKSHWYDPQGADKLRAAQSGGAAAPMRALVQIGLGGPASGCYGHLDLLDHPDPAASSNVNVACLTTPPTHVSDGSYVTLAITAPEFSAGSLAVAYAELLVSSADGSQWACVSVDAVPLPLSSGQVLMVPFDDAGMAGSDGSNDVPLLPAGAEGNPNTDFPVVGLPGAGAYVASCFVRFTATGLTA